jgi:hypothetical protein
VNRNEQQPLSDIQVDRNNLYREENYTDLKVASIRRLVPVKPDGTPDMTRRQVFIGQTHLMSQMGPLPVQCNIEAADPGRGAPEVSAGAGAIRGGYDGGGQRKAAPGVLPDCGAGRGWTAGRASAGRGDQSDVGRKPARGCRRIPKAAGSRGRLAGITTRCGWNQGASICALIYVSSGFMASLSSAISATVSGCTGLRHGPTGLPERLVAAFTEAL